MFALGLDDWVRAYSPGDWGALLRRMEWDGIQPARARAALEGRLTVPGPDASFRRSAERIVELCARATAPDAAHLEIPFIQLWEPFLRLAVDTFSTTHGAKTGLLSPEAQADLSRNLALQLAWCGTPSAWQAFDTERTRSGAGYDTFCQAILSSPLAFFSEHATLFRRLVLLGEQWAAASGELLDRLEADRDAIESLTGPPALPISRVRPGLSDRHHEGRQVAVLTAASGRRVVYKPRASHSLERFNDLLRWHGTVDPALAPRAIDVIARDDYAWIEYVEQQQLDTPEEVAGYFRRAGALLFFAWLLGGRDLHMDNIVASKRSPVIVDTEVFAHPAWARTSMTGALQLARDRISSSIVGTGMLSFPQQDADGKVYDIGGLAGSGGYTSPPRRTWHEVNTDAMHLTEESREVAPMENVVRCRGVVERPEDHVPRIVDGFEAAFGAVLAHRDALVSAGGVLDRFREAETRILFRPSNQYASLLQLLTGPSCSRLGVTTSLYIESLGRLFASLEKRPELWLLVRQERRALEHLDIPLFTISCAGTTIESESGETITGLIDQSGADALVERVRALDRPALHEQTRLIAATLTSSSAHSSEEDETPLTAFHAPEPAAISTAISHIADAIMSAAVRGGDGAATWIAPEYVKINTLADIGATYYLYSGVTGIGIFLAGFSRATGNADAMELARAAWVPLERLLETGDVKDVQDHLRLGIANGIGSIVYSAVLTSQLSGDASLLDIASGFADMLTNDRLLGETDLDVEGGVAGAVLALHRLHLATGEQRWLDRATTAARRLVDESTLDADGRSWQSDSKAPSLAGMAHGAAGIGLTLASIGASSGDRKLLDAAGQAFAWERSVFDSSTGNWPVRISDGRSINMIAWCHGAPGIGLSRIGAGLDETSSRSDLETAVTATRASGIHPVDHVCCGNSGRIDFLIEASLTLGDALILEEARHRAGAMVSRAARKGDFTLSEESGGRMFRPGFFRGLAGVGYTLLRSLEPDSLPSVIRFALKGEPRS